MKVFIKMSSFLFPQNKKAIALAKKFKTAFLLPLNISLHPYPPDLLSIL